MQLLTVTQLSALIHKAESSIYSDLIRNPKSLPPLLRINGSRRVLFRDVDQWLQNQMIVPPAAATTQNTKLGRPRKSEQLTRDRRVADASPTRGINRQ